MKEFFQVFLIGLCLVLGLFGGIFFIMVYCYHQGRDGKQVTRNPLNGRLSRERETLFSLFYLSVSK